MNNPPSDPAVSPRVWKMEEYVRFCAEQGDEEPFGGGPDPIFWTKGPSTPLSRRVEGLASAFEAWVAGHHEPVGNEVHIHPDKQMAWRESDWPKKPAWQARWVDREGMDPRQVTLASLHRELVPYLLASPHHQPPEWPTPPTAESTEWRLDATVERASDVIRALLVELVAEGKITITPETAVTAVEHEDTKGPYVITHNVWSHIATKLWDPEWDWRQLRVRKA